MPRSCTVCAHPERGAIDEALVAGEAFRHIAARFDTSTGALQRHKADHLPARLLLAAEAEERTGADDLLGQVKDLQARAYAILDAAEDTGQLRTALAAIKEARASLELLAKLVGELQDGPTVNVLVSAQWIELRAVIVGALETYPDARGAVLKAIEAVGDGGA